MRAVTSPSLTRLLGGAADERALALVKLGRWDDADLALIDIDDRERTPIEVALLLGRGEFLAALRMAAEGDSGALLHATVLAILGRVDEALGLLEGADDPCSAILRAQIYLQSGESSPASVELPRELPALGDGAAATAFERAVDDLRRAEWTLAKAELVAATEGPAVALGLHREARDRARRLGAVGLEAKAEAALGEVHADARNPWRALRAVTRGLDLVATGAVDAGFLAGIYYRSFVVYGMLGHKERSEAALATGHHRIVQLASGIEDHRYRETFFMDNRDCQRLVAAWKGDAQWGRALLERYHEPDDEEDDDD